jgi:hypothetical protein
LDHVDLAFELRIAQLRRHTAEDGTAAQFAGSSPDFARFADGQWPAFEFLQQPSFWSGEGALNVLNERVNGEFLALDWKHNLNVQTTGAFAGAPMLLP